MVLEDPRGSASNRLTSLELSAGRTRPIKQPIASVVGWLTCLPASSSSSALARSRFEGHRPCVSAAGVEAVLIIDTSRVANDAVGIEDKNLRITRGAERIGERVVEIL